MIADEQLLTIQQISSETQIPVSWLYARSRRGALPGMRRLGKYIRINSQEFFSALRAERLK